ncbi:oxidoreductase C-terminal domain-containing protein [Streptomyces chartreusis]|uniref:oxidoreductase C-terminal domain-containing protein n=1 Tax=Streptomyces chartreusis TaxID=1969 RepID=UPI00342C894C
MIRATSAPCQETDRKASDPSVCYFWSDQYDMRIQAYGYLRGHDEAAGVEGDVAERRFVAVCRIVDRVSGALAVGVPPRELRRWRQAIAMGVRWREAV